MKFTLYTSNGVGQQANCFYPNQVIINNKEELKAAVAYDHVCAKYDSNYRSNDNFITSDCVVMDIDNDHSDNPADWINESMVHEYFHDVDYALVTSRNHMVEKNGKKARPKYHIYFPIDPCTSTKTYTTLKNALFHQYQFFDGNAVDAARFLFGSNSEVEWNEGWLSLQDILMEDFVMDEEDDITVFGTILEGSRNNTMSHFAGRVLKKLGVCDKAKESFLERAAKCDPPLSNDELKGIWNSAIKFYEKVSKQQGYVAPDEYNNEFGSCYLKPKDYSDMGQAKVLAKECMNRLRFTSATDFMAFQGDHWHEDKQKALGVVEDFMDLQLMDAIEAVRNAEEALIAIGVSEVDVKSRSKDLTMMVPLSHIGLLHALLSADNYKKFVMKNRNYRNLVNIQNAAKPMIAIDVSEFDYDYNLLNTPKGTYDLTKGFDGMHEHDPDDLITKVTAVSPGDKGRNLWEDALELFFCGDKELIDYVQEIVGMAAIGKIYAEHMIIAYGDGANGKSTFWNTIARVLGNYSGKLSAEALTVGCKRNVKPEMAELKGKRLIIASELEEGTRLNTGMVKQLCSTDPIEAEKKFKDPFHFDPSHTLVLYTNHLPKVSSVDNGTWRRLIVIPFNATITGKSDIKNYSDYLFQQAGPSIMMWIIEGAKKAFDKNFTFDVPKVVEDAIKHYREDSDWLGNFLTEHCEIGPNLEAKSGELYQTYRAYCMLNGEHIRCTKDFYGSIEKAGFTRQKRKIGRFVIGLCLKENDDTLC